MVRVFRLGVVRIQQASPFGPNNIGPRYRERQSVAVAKLLAAFDKPKKLGDLRKNY